MKSNEICKVLPADPRIGSFQNAIIWTVVEANVGIICGCLPTLRPTLRALRNKLAQRASASQPSRGTRIPYARGHCYIPNPDPRITARPFQRLDRDIKNFSSTTASLDSNDEVCLIPLNIIQVKKDIFIENSEPPKRQS